MKKWFAVFVALIIAIPLVLADILGTLSNVWWTIINTIGDLGFLGMGGDTAVVAFTRILVWILVFTILFAVITIGKKGDKDALGFLKRNQTLVISAVIATISAIFLPGTLLAAIGAGTATIVAFALIGGPVVGVAYVLWKIPWEGKETRWTVFVKLVMCLLLFWILSVMKYHVAGLT